MQSANKVALNTGILYGRMIITMILSLYTTRIILNALGATDYGIYNLVAGVIAMLSFLNVAMTTSSQRYLSYYQGKKDVKMQAKVFTHSLMLHIFIGILLIIVFEIMGLFLFGGMLNIPLNRIHAAKVIYHFMCGTVFFTVVAVPFNGSLLAHENMLWVAFVNIIESILKLVIAIVIIGISSDKLIYYGFFTAIISIVSFLLYSFYCLQKYDECSLKNVYIIDRKFLKELTSFATWNLFGALCGIGKTEGLAVLFNVFFGTIINAAYGIAIQISGQLNFFSVTMLRALNPQIMRSEGLNDRKRMIKLSMIANKFGFALLAVIAIPCIFVMPTLLKLWLHKVPDFTVEFCSLILIATMINQLTIGLDSAVQATGNIKKYMLVVGSAKILILPLGYLSLKLGFPIYSVLYQYIAFEFIGGMLRIYILKKQIGISLSDYTGKVILPLLTPVILSVGICFLVTSFVIARFQLITTLASSIIVFSISLYMVGLSIDERSMINNLIKKNFVKSVVWAQNLKN